MQAGTVVVDEAVRLVRERTHMAPFDAFVYRKPLRTGQHSMGSWDWQSLLVPYSACIARGTGRNSVLCFDLSYGTDVSRSGV